MEHATASSADLGPTSSDWKSHKQLIRHLYVDQNLPLGKVMKQMREQYRFDATQPQYKRQLKTWNFRKNITDAEMRVIARIRQQEQRKDLVFRLHGQIVPSRKIERWMNRWERKANSHLVENDAFEAEILKHLKYWPRDQPKNSVEEPDEATDSASEDEDVEPIARNPEIHPAEDTVRTLPSASTALHDGNFTTMAKCAEQRSSDLNSEQWGFSQSSNDKASNSQRCVSVNSPTMKPADHWQRKEREGKWIIDDTVSHHDERTDSHQTKQPKSIKFSCPYRKRNPVAFNVRTRRTCALMSFPNLAELKRHVVTSHERESVCPVCGDKFSGSDELAQHQRVHQPCVRRMNSPNLDPEQGITPGIKDTLKSRRAEDKVNTWEQLWKVLFPDDRDIPEPDFQPPLEVKEATSFLIDQADQFASDIMGFLMPLTHPPPHNLLHLRVIEAYKASLQRALVKICDSKEGISDMQPNSEETTTNRSTLSPPGSVWGGISDLQSNNDETISALSASSKQFPNTSATEWMSRPPSWLDISIANSGPEEDSTYSVLPPQTQPCISDFGHIQPDESAEWFELYEANYGSFLT